MSRLDARVRSLEGQGVRTDRCAAELGGLAQALTEEQRALLIRLDRLEEQVRAGGASRYPREMRLDVKSETEDTNQRLERFEQEQRMAATNLRLVMSLLEESEQRQQQRLRSLEEQVVNALKSTPTHPAPEEAKSDTVTTCGEALRLQLSAAESKTARSLKSAQDLLVRCTTGAKTTSAQENMETVDPRLGAQALESHDDAICALKNRLGELVRNLAPRTDQVEARVQKVSDAAQGLQGQTLGRIETRLQALTNAMEILSKQSQDGNGVIEDLKGRILSLPTREQVMEMGHARELACTSRRIDIHESRLAELWARFELSPTRDQVLSACKDAECSQQSYIRVLQVRMDELEAERCRSQPRVVEKLESHDVHIKSLQERLDGMQSTQLRVEQLQAEASKDEMVLMGRHLEDHSTAISDLRSQLLAVPSMQQLVEMKELLDGQQVRLEALTSQDKHVESVTIDSTSNMLLESSKDHAKSIADVRLQLQALPIMQQFREVQELVVSQLSQLECLSNETSRTGAASADVVSEIQCRLPTPCRLPARTEEAPSEANLVLKEADVHTIVQSHMAAIAQKCGRVEVCDGGDTPDPGNKALLDAQSEEIIELRAHIQALSSRGDDGDFCPGVESLEIVGGASPETELSSVLARVCKQFQTLQEKMEDRVLVSISQVEQQLPDALRQLDRLSSGYADHAARVEEHEVRLGLAIARQATGEQKFQDCMDRVEQLPSTSRIRALCHEALASRLAESDLEPKFEDFSKRLELTMDAVTELSEKVYRCQMGRDPAPARLLQAISPQSSIAAASEIQTDHHAQGCQV